MAGRYVLSLVTAALIGGIVTGFFPEGSFRRLLRMLCGVFLLTVVLSPVSALEMPDIGAWLSSLDEEARAAATQGEDYLSGQRQAVICRKTEAYILDKARELGAEVSARVTLNREELPESVALTGSCTPAQKEALTILIEEDLGIPEARQQWQQM